MKLKAQAMLRSKPGDVYEVRVLENYAYIQHVRTFEIYGTLVRVFTRLYQSRPENPGLAISGPSFRVFYSIDTVLKAKPPLITFVDNRTLPAIDEAPIRFRGGNYVVEEGKPTKTITNGNFSPDEKALPSFSYPSHGYLLWQILRANNIEVPDPNVLVPNMGSSQLPGDHTVFFLYFKTKRDATLAAAKISLDLQFTDFKSHIQRSDKDWLLRLNKKLDRPLAEVVDLLATFAASCGGMFDGFEQPASTVPEK